eukprot:Tbor_TRINITY_DN6004_c0_g2::TRINITY_DN6004_c0_g2_i3::g.10194::m.10194
MIGSKMTGTSNLVFGNKDKPFKLPPNSRIRIIDSELTTSYTDTDIPVMFTFHRLQLVTDSSIEITRNVITVGCEGCANMDVFVPTGMIVSGGSSSHKPPSDMCLAHGLHTHADT